jgi:hypothetical protein
MMAGVGAIAPNSAAATFPTFSEKLELAGCSFCNLIHYWTEL